MPLPSDAAFYREMHVHETFRLSRSSAVEAGVYDGAFAALDSYCDPRQGEERKPPFVLEGSSGSGKSTVLALWAQRRRQNADAVKLREVVVYHHAGASAESTRLSLMLYRLSAMLQQVCELSDLKVGAGSRTQSSHRALSAALSLPPLTPSSSLRSLTAGRARRRGAAAARADAIRGRCGKATATRRRRGHRARSPARDRDR